MSRLFGATGAVFGLLAMVASAYVAHGAAFDSHDRMRLALAVAFQIVHALVLLHIATHARSRALLLTLSGWFAIAGVVLFCGSLWAGVMLQWPTVAAPFGGIALMLSWLLLAVWHLGAPPPPSQWSR